MDAMLTCRQCKWITGALECGVAANRAARHKRDPESVKGDFPRWRYRPVLDKLVRCEFGEKR